MPMTISQTYGYVNIVSSLIFLNRKVIKSLVKLGNLRVIFKRG